MPLPHTSKALILIVLFLGLSAPGGVSGQSVGGSETISFSLIVFDARGKAIQNLKSADIRVAVDGKERRLVELITPDKEPVLTIGAIFDVSGSQDLMVPQNVQADLLEFFKNTLRPVDRAFVGEFAESFRQLSSISDDPVYLASSVLSASKPHGKTALFDAVSSILTHQFTGMEGRKAMVVLSDGDSNAGRVSMKNTIDELRRDDVIVHTIFVAGRDGGISHRYGGSNVPPGFEPMFLFPQLTGGLNEMGNDDKQLIEAFRRIAEALRTTYTVICAAEPSDHNGKPHKVKIKINREGAQAFARDSYVVPQI
jgi:VWFA-related protein